MADDSGSSRDSRAASTATATATPLEAALRSEHDAAAAAKKSGGGGVVLGPDGKPCRSCTSVRDWMRMASTKSSSSSTMTSPTSSTTTNNIPPDCPPDVELLGRSTWTLLHTMAATYPSTATPSQQSDMRQFLSSFSRLYPCWTCAADFRGWMGARGNEPKVGGRSELGVWLCEAHNEVNKKLGKKVFDCRTWEERWKDGWKDGRCG